jgi:ribosomal protein L37E
VPASAVLTPTRRCAPMPGQRAQPACGSCGSDRLSSFALVLTDGTNVTFSSCRSCERRSYHSAEGPLDLDIVMHRSQRRH